MSTLGCIFDCDGTLVDSVAGWRRLDYDLARLAGATLSAEDVATLCTLTLDEAGVFYHTKFGLGKTPHDVVQMADDILIDFYTNAVEARPGALSFVEGLVRAGIPVSLASSSPQRYLRPCLERVGLKDYIPFVVSTEDEEVNAPKRQPKIYQHCAQLMGTDIASTWGFEDSIYAVRTLINGGFRCVGCYDRDDSAKLEDLRRESHLVIESFADTSAEEFLAFARAY